IVMGRDWIYEGVRGVDNSHVVRRLKVMAGPDPEFIPPATEFPLVLSGEHQLGNAAVALAALDRVRGRFPALNLAALIAGLATVQWDGRLQLLREGNGRPAVLVACAHNDDSAGPLGRALSDDYHYRRLILVFGAPEDKNVAGMMDRLLPLADEVVVTTSNHPRSATPERLAEMALERGRSARVTHSVSEAMTTALVLAEPGDMVVATGSIVVIGDLLNHWDTLQSAG
ncbi:MAG TPA: cyanophycin synthetase, partial [Promineifilum sp.]|nr:cyanophycin synthetase [Promineifilum sp.]